MQYHLVETLRSDFRKRIIHRRKRPKLPNQWKDDQDGHMGSTRSDSRDSLRKTGSHCSLRQGYFTHHQLGISCSIQQDRFGWTEFLRRPFGMIDMHLVRSLSLCVLLCSITNNLNGINAQICLFHSLVDLDALAHESRSSLFGSHASQTNLIRSKQFNEESERWFRRSHHSTAGVSAILGRSHCLWTSLVQDETIRHTSDYLSSLHTAFERRRDDRSNRHGNHREFQVRTDSFHRGLVIDGPEQLAE